MEFFLEMFIFVCLFLLLLSFSLLTFVFISGQNVVSSSKDTATTTAAVELIKGTIIDLFYLTLKIVYYSRELSVQ